MEGIENMTQEEKEFLLRDLSARLPYGVIVDYKEDEYDFHHWKISTLNAPSYSREGNLINIDSDGWIKYDEYKGCGISTGLSPLCIEITLPFLRPMSSMTDEERKEYEHLVAFSGSPNGAAKLVDWLNKKMFAYRTIDNKDMFELGLALQAPKGIYK